MPTLQRKRRTLVFAVLSSLLVATSTASNATSARAATDLDPLTTAVNASGALGYYRLNDSDGTLRDTSVHRANGRYGSAVAHNGPVLTAFGDRTVTFPGGSYNTGRFASAPLNKVLQPSSAVTVEAWIREVSVAGSHGLIPIVAYGKQSQGPAYTLMINNQNTIQFYVHTTRAFNIEGITHILPGVVYHVAATFDGRKAAIYLNGALERSMSASGSIEYANLNSHDGLGIGGSLDAGSPQFDGNISQVAIYGSGLSESTVSGHYSAGVLPLVLTEQAHSSSSVIDTIGLNTHFHYTGTVYDTQFNRLKGLLVTLGVRHIRDGLLDTSWKTYYTRLNELGAAGIKSTLVTSFNQSAALLAGFPARVASTFEAYEPPNEPDLNAGKNWISETRNFQKMLYTSVKHNSASAKYAVLGPAVTNLQDFEALGNLSQYMDVGNFHQYFPGFNPGTQGWGSTSSYGTYGAINWNLNVARIVDGNHPSDGTETGYNFANNARGNLPPDVGAKYVPRLVFEMLNHGVRRAFIYQLADFENESYFECGLIAQNMTPKAPYYALKSLITLLADAHPRSNTNVVRYSLSGNLSNVDHTLMQRGDGTYQLALWIEGRSITPTPTSSNGTRLVLSPQRVTVTVPSTVRAVAANSISTSGGIVSVATTRSGSKVTLNVTDAITIVHLAF